MKKLISCGLLLISCCLNAGVKLVTNGENPAEIVVGGNANGVVQFAAQELAYFLERVSGSKFAIKSQSTAPVRIFLGDSAEARNAGLTPQENEHIIAVQDNGNIFILGQDSTEKGPLSVERLIGDIDPKGTLDAVYAFLEDCIGVRWIAPGAKGECFKTQRTIELPVIQKRIIPTHPERRSYYFRFIKTWWYHGKQKDLDEYGTPTEVLQWGLRLHYSSTETGKIYGCHTPSYLHFDKHLFKSRPELFATLSNGTKTPKDLCWSSQAVEDFLYNLADCYFRGDASPQAAGIDEPKWNAPQYDPNNRKEFMLDPHDYQDSYCQCPDCLAYKAKYADHPQGELVLKAIFKVADRIYQKYPDRIISTLVYPPKDFFPSDKTVPPNVRVRVTVPWGAIDTSTDVYKETMAVADQWAAALNEKPPMWGYIMSAFGSLLYGVPEAVAHKAQDFFLQAKKHLHGVFFEHIEPTHTMRHIDLYVIGHILWNDNVDVDSLMDELFVLYFGAAAPEMKEFYSRLESNWSKVITMHKLANNWGSAEGSPLLKRVFDEIYTYQEITYLDFLLDKATAKVVMNSNEARRIDCYRQHVMGLVKQEYPLHSSDKTHFTEKPQPLCCLFLPDQPCENDWETVPWQKMAAAEEGKEMSVKSEFKTIYADQCFYLKARFEEPLMAQSKTIDRKNTPKWDAVWDDNEAELFFCGDSGKIVQILVNDLGHYVCFDQITRKATTDIPGIVTRAVRTSTGWELYIEVPDRVSGFAPASTKDRFNFTRTRNINGVAKEYQTATTQCNIKRWSRPSTYMQIFRLKPVIDKPVYSGKARPVSDTKMETYIAANESCQKNAWQQWKEKRSQAMMTTDNQIGHTNKGARVIDASKESLEGKEFSANWRLTVPSPAQGTVVRVSAWVLCETPNPIASIAMDINWNEQDGRWLFRDSHSHNGIVTFPVKSGSWQKMEAEITVPDVREIAFISASFSGDNVRPGKIWISDVEMQIHNPQPPVKK